MSIITAEMFRHEFIREWEERNQSNAQHLRDCYMDDPRCTNLMLGRGQGVMQEQGVLERVFFCINERVGPAANLKFKHEWYTIDALIVGGENLFRGELAYPSRIEALIEHENGDNWEEEMWKLLFWRAPLKVLIGYDYYEDEYDQQCSYRGKKIAKRDWLQCKLKSLREMYDKVSPRPPSSEEYLLLVGSRANRSVNSDVRWHWCRIDQPESMPQSLRPAGE